MYYQTENFPGLDRYRRQHDIEAVITHWDKIPTEKEIKDAVRYSLEIEITDVFCLTKIVRKKFGFRLIVLIRKLESLSITGTSSLFLELRQGTVLFSAKAMEEFLIDEG